jgi:hypothetical protein
MQFFPVIWVYIYLPVTVLKIESGEPFGSSQRVQFVVNSGQWKTVFLYDIVQFSVVQAEAEIPIPLPDQNYGGRPGSCLIP